MRTRYRYVWLFVPLMVACNGQLSEDEEQLVKAWLTCVECVDGEDTMVVNVLHSRAVTSLIDALAGGADAARRRQNMATRFGRQYLRIQNSPDSADSAQFVNRYLANYDALSQRRAAYALGQIRTPEAITAIEESRDQSFQRAYRRDVVQAVREALLAAQGVPFQGSLGSSRVAFLDTVVIADGPSGTAFAGTESVTLLGAPFADDLVVERWASDSFAFVAVGRVGRYGVAIENTATGQTAAATLQIRSFPRRPAGLCAIDDLPCILGLAWQVPTPALPHTVYRSLSSQTAPPDTVHFYRIAPSSRMLITARAAVDDSTALAVGWLPCSVPSPAAAGAVEGLVLTEEGNPILGARVNVVGSPVLSTTNALGRFTITNVASAPTNVLLRAQHIGFRSEEYPARTGGRPVRITLARTQRIADRPAAIDTIAGGDCRLLRVRRREPGTSIVQLRVDNPSLSIAVLAGNDQRATTGTAVAGEPTVVVWNAQGQPAQGVNVTFTVQEGGGSVSTAMDNTGVDGLVVTQWTLGPVGIQRLRASLSTGSFVDFIAAAVP